MNRRRRNDVAAAATEVDSRQDPCSVAQAGRQDEVVIALSGLDHRSAQPFPAGPCFFKGINCSLAIKIKYVEADPGCEADVRCRMILKPPLDHFRIGRGVVQPPAAIGSRDQRLLRARCQKEDLHALRCVRQCGGKVVHVVSLFTSG